jgi:hypothetical protein
MTTEGVTLLHAGYPAALLKACAAKHFVDLLDKHRQHQVLALYYFDAFLSAARAVTWALQAECRGLPGFEQWYGAWVQRMKSQPSVAVFRDWRNEAEKEGPHRPELEFAYEILHHLDGRVDVGSLNVTIKAPGGGVDAVELCRTHVAMLMELVDEGRTLGYPPQGPIEQMVAGGIRPMREKPDGTWVSFEPPHWEPKPEEFASRSQYDDWRRRLPRRRPPSS